MRRFLMRAGAMASIAIALMMWSVSRSEAAAPCLTCNDGGYAVNYGGSNVYSTGYTGYYGNSGYYNGYGYGGYNGFYARPGIIRRVGGAVIGTVGGAVSGFWQGLTEPGSLFTGVRCGRCPLAGGYCRSCGIVCQPMYTTSYGCTPCSAPCAPMPCEAPCAAPAPCAPMPCEAPCAAPAPCAPMPCEAPCAAPAPCAPMP
ncbi:MAG: hypothetical protein PHE53_13820, partial [Thermoguttaceae bacterium]|nr:hypothetical protein [Thermoguttaceae bacterium]